LKLGALMDVAMNLLGGGLQVGVDARQEGVFLLQMGIYCTAKPESLDFMSELCLYPAPNQQVRRTHCWFSPMQPTFTTISISKLNK